MNVRIGGRGHSFKGAGLYYLHDKDAETRERVGFTYTHNMNTQDPDRAVKLMTFTANNAEYLKDQAGIKKTGAKRKEGTVYTYSINYEQDKQPSKKQMVNDAKVTLERLGLKDHQALFIEHTDTDHAHVHIMANLINPNDGRVHVPSWSKLKCSDWALEKEREQGHITSPEREKNHEKRKRGEFVKYKEKPHERKALIQTLYKNSDNGKAFKAALNENEFALCQGDRRGWVLVDEQGKIHSLSRQLDKEQKKTYQTKLEALDRDNIPLARDISQERIQKAQNKTKEINISDPNKEQHWDRDAYNAQWEKGVIDNAVLYEQTQKKNKQNKKEEAKEVPLQSQQLEREKGLKELVQKRKIFVAGKRPKNHQDFNELEEKGFAGEKKKETSHLSRKKSNFPPYDDSHLEKLDKLRAWNNMAIQKRHKLEKQLEETHSYKSMIKQKAYLEVQLEKFDTLFCRMTGKRKSIEQNLIDLNLTIEHSERRMKEAHNTLENELAKTKPKEFKSEDTIKHQKLKLNKDQEIEAYINRRKEQSGFQTPKLKDSNRSKNLDLRR